MNICIYVLFSLKGKQKTEGNTAEYGSYAGISVVGAQLVLPCQSGAGEAICLPPG